MAEEFASAFVRFFGDRRPLNRDLRGAETSVRASSRRIGQTFTNQFNQGLRGAGTILGGFTSRFATLGPIIANPFVIGAVAIGSFVLALRGAIKAASEFELVFAEVRTLLDESQVATEVIKEELLALPPVLGNARDLTRALYQALSAGVEPAAAVRFVGEAARLATAGLTSTFAAVDILTTVINAYGFASEDAGKISDILFKTVERGKTTVDALSKSLGTAIPFAVQVGVSFEEVGAALATLTKAGLSTDIATTALRATFVSLIQNVDQFRKLGIDVIDLVGEKGLQGVFEELQRVTGGNVEQIRELFPETRALAAVLTLAGKGAEEFALNNEILANATGATETAFQKIANTLKIQSRALSAAFERLNIEVGEVFLPAMVKVVQALTRFFEISRSAIQGIKDFVNAVREADERTNLWIASLFGLQDVQREAEIAARDTAKSLREESAALLEAAGAAGAATEVGLALRAQARELTAAAEALEKKIDQDRMHTKALANTRKELEQNIEQLKAAASSTKISGALREKVNQDIERQTMLLAELVNVEKGEVEAGTALAAVIQKQVDNLAKSTNELDKNTEARKENAKEAEEIVKLERQLASAAVNQRIKNLTRTITIGAREAAKRAKTDIARFKVEQQAVKDISQVREEALELEIRGLERRRQEALRAADEDEKAKVRALQLSLEIAGAEGKLIDQRTRTADEVLALDKRIEESKKQDAQEAVERESRIFQLRRELGEISLADEVRRLDRLIIAQRGNLEARLNAEREFAAAQDALRDRARTAGERILMEVQQRLAARGITRATAQQIEAEFEALQRERAAFAARVKTALATGQQVDLGILVKAVSETGKLERAQREILELGGFQQIFEQGLSAAGKAGEAIRDFQSGILEALGVQNTAVAESLTNVSTAYSEAFEKVEGTVSLSIDRILERIEEGNAAIVTRVRETFAEQLTRAIEREATRI